MKNGILLTLIILYSSPSYTQITGSVMDSGQQTLPGVHVVLYKMPDKSLENTAITDSLGRYRVVPKSTGNYMLQFSFLGMHNLETEEITYQNTSLDMGNVTMQEKPHELDGVVINVVRPQVRFETQGFHNTTAFEEFKQAAIIGQLFLSIR